MESNNGAPTGPVGARPIGDPPRKRGAAGWLGLLALLVLAVVVVLLLLSRCGDDGSSTTSGTSSATSSATPSMTSSMTPSMTSASPGTSAGVSPGTATASSAGAGTGTITVGDRTLLPLSGNGALSTFTGQEAIATSVEVESVPADEGFWVGSDAQHRVWVQLTGEAGESPFTVKAGDSVAFTGKVTANPTGFADSAGVTAEEGAALLDTQGQHIAVARSALKLAP